MQSTSMNCSALNCRVLLPFMVATVMNSEVGRAEIASFQTGKTTMISGFLFIYFLSYIKGEGRGSILEVVWVFEYELFRLKSNKPFHL